MAITAPNPRSHPLTVRARALVFEDPRSRELLRQIRQIAPSEATVLVIGETGTGKEIVSRYVHELSRRASAPFVAVNCGAFSENLIDAELFGYERGAFTGAISSKSGWFEAANGGTLFLDEIGDLSLPLQVKLLRVLQEREVVRLGSRTPIAIDVRLVAATNVDLAAAVREGRFREDLFFRLNVASLTVPPLRERPGDILPLTEHFLRIHGQRCGVDDPTLSDEAVQRLLDHRWPGNIRELENVLHRAVLTSQSSLIDAKDLSLHAGRNAPAEPTSASATDLASLERALVQLFEQGTPDLYDKTIAAVVRYAYAFCHENQVQTAQLLGISRNVLRSRLALSGVIAGRRNNKPQAPVRQQPRTAAVPDRGDYRSPHHDR